MADKRNAMGKTAEMYMVLMSRAMAVAAAGRSASCNITTVFCALGIQACINRMNHKSLSALGIRPVKTPALSRAKAVIGIRVKRENMSAATRDSMPE